VEHKVTEIKCACGRRHVVDVQPDAGDERGQLLFLADGPLGMKPGTLQRWAREGRLRAFQLERGKLACWERDLRDAIEATPIAPAASAPSLARRRGGPDPQEAALDELLSGKAS